MTSLVPTGVPAGFSPKTFWQRPEGAAGKALLVLGVGAVGVAFFIFWGAIVPFVVATLADTLLACVYAGILIVVGMTAFGIPPFGVIRQVIRNAFQSLSRGIARCFVEIDPIGILRNNLDDMKKEKASLDSTVEKFSGSEEQLQRKIEEKTQTAKKYFAQGQIATQKANAATDALSKQKYALASQTYTEQAGMLLQGVKQLESLEKDTSHLLETFQNWSQLADAKIQRTSFKVDFLAEQRQIIVAAKSTLSFGQRLLKGKPEQEQMVDMAIEYLEQDTAQTLGQIREFSRFTDKLTTDQDIESGANAEIARQQFAEFSQKLITAGSTPTVADLIQIPGMSTPVPVPVGANTVDNFDPFK